jgi:hypothetical protein
MVAFAALPLACAEAPETGAEPSSGAAASVSVEGAAAQPDTNRLVFRDQFADGGELKVVKDASSRVSFSVEAPIGSNAETLMQRAQSVSSLAGVYGILHEGKQPVPATLATLSSELEAASPATLEPRLTPALDENVSYGPLAQTNVDKSKSAFLTRYCKEFFDGNVRYKPGPANQWCFWDNTRGRMCLSFIFTNGVNSGTCAPYGMLDSNGSTLIDRAYGWNATAYTATMAIGGGFTPTNNTWRPTVSPYTVMWVQWGGVYDGANATIYLPSGKTGELGLTAHTASFI